MDKHPHLSHSRSSSGHRAEHSDPFVWRKVEEDLIGRSVNLAAVVRGLVMRRVEASLLVAFNLKVIAGYLGSFRSFGSFGSFGSLGATWALVSLE